MQDRPTAPEPDAPELEKPGPIKLEEKSEADRHDQDDAAEPAAPLTKADSGSWLSRLSPGSLTARIALINLLGLIILTGGILYSNQFRQGLIEARILSLRTQAQIISAAIAGSATVDTSSIVINPDLLEDPTESANEVDQFSELNFPISPESAGPVLRRLLANTTIRARIIDQDGNLVVDSRTLYGGNDIESTSLTDSAPAQGNRLVRLWNRALDWVFASDYPAYVEYALDGNQEFPEVRAALNGASVSLVRLNDAREVVIMVSVPVQRFRAVLGSLVLSTQGGEIDRLVRADRNAVLLTFLVSSLVTLLLSALLAGMIANPIRRLSAAADRVRRGISKRVEIPDFGSRKDEIGNLSGSLRDMTAALYNRIDAIEAFAADVSHELKNPLTSLRSAVETLGYVKTDEQRKKLIDVVVQDVKRMDRLITDISDASRLDAELARSDAAPVDVEQLLTAIVDMANATAKDHDAQVTLQVSQLASSKQGPGQGKGQGKGQSKSYVISGQDSRLGQVFRNLIDNARSFTAENTKIALRLRRVGNEVDIRVEDSGPGIRPENLERVFERFYTDRPEQSFGKNSGLGLAISRQIVEAHKGRIWAENRTGKVIDDGEREILGARFVVRLPAVDAA
jgi:two-component system, OmpR family, sensor histidine kinase ChvG